MGGRRSAQLVPAPLLDPLRFERAHWQRGRIHIAGVDEVGRGCLAGPVVAAAVILPPACTLHGIDDSKRLRPDQREQLYNAICAAALSYAVGIVDQAEIDAINILQATRKAMQHAVERLAIRPQHLLIDGRQPIGSDIGQTVIVRGDHRSMTVAAASILAKVTRDRMTVAWERDYPAFRFSLHKGYGTARHLAELSAHGPTPLHRRTFAPIRRLTA